MTQDETVAGKDLSPLDEFDKDNVFDFLNMNMQLLSDKELEEMEDLVIAEKRNRHRAILQTFNDLANKILELSKRK